MKITKFREVLTGEQIEQHQEVVRGINEANTSITSAVNSANGLITSAVNSANSLITSAVKEVDSRVQEATESIQTNTQKVEELNQSVKGVEARTDKTKIYNQKIEEDIIILESRDEDFSIPDDTCDDIFIPSLRLSLIHI